MIFLILIILLLMPGYGFLFLILPRIGTKKDLAGFKKFYFAHRGLHDLTTMTHKPELIARAKDEGRPENSLAAFAAACEAGYGVELDVQLTKDLVPVVFHDWTLERVCHVPGFLRDYTYEELQQFSLGGTDEKIPRLTEVLSLIGGRIPIILEYKSENKDMTVCEVTDPILQSYQGPLVIESFNPMVLYWYKKHRPEVTRGQLSAVYREKNTLSYKASTFFFHHLLFNFLTRPDFIAYETVGADCVARTLCRNLYRNPAVAWTVHSEKERKELKKSFDLFIFEGFRP